MKLVPLSGKERKRIESKLTLRERVAHELRCLRIDAGLTQMELARKMMTKQPCIARIEDGMQNVSLDLIERWLKAARGSCAFSIRKTPPPRWSKGRVFHRRSRAGK